MFTDRKSAVIRAILVGIGAGIGSLIIAAASGDGIGSESATRAVISGALTVVLVIALALVFFVKKKS